MTVNMLVRGMPSASATMTIVYSFIRSTDEQVKHSQEKQFKGIVNPKIKILSFTHPLVVTNLYTFLDI